MSAPLPAFRFSALLRHHAQLIEPLGGDVGTVLPEDGLVEVELDELIHFVEDALARKNSNIFGFSFGLVNFLTLRNENIFSFPSLNRNFALTLTLSKILSLKKAQILLAFYSLIRNFAA